jgi:hypothetical protein
MNDSISTNTAAITRPLSLTPCFSWVCTGRSDERNRFNGFRSCVWGRGYVAFSVSHSGVAEVAKYIANQEGHHRKKSFSEEFKLFVTRCELKWHDSNFCCCITPLFIMLHFHLK